MINPLLKEDDETQKPTYKKTNILSATISPVFSFAAKHESVDSPISGWGFAVGDLSAPRCVANFVVSELCDDMKDVHPWKQTAKTPENGGLEY